MKKKLQTQSGMTLVELLVAMMIMLLAGVGMSIGLKSAIQVYDRSLFSSESLVLQDTINTTLGDYLRYATKETIDGKELIKINGRGSGSIVSGVASAGSFTEGDGYLYFVVGDKKNLMLNSGAYSNMKVQYTSCNYEDGVFTVNYQIKSANGKGIKLCTVQFRSLAAA